MATGKVTIPLRPDAFEKWDKEKEALEAAIEDEETTASKIFTVANHSMEKERLQNNEYAAALNKYAMESVLADVYIQEAFSIITDLIKLQKK
jgi:hypothetical protein